MAMRIDKTSTSPKAKGVVDNSAKIVELEKDLVQASEFQKLATAMVDYYIKGLYNQYTENYPGGYNNSMSPAEYRVWFTNSPKFLVAYYPDGSEHGPLTQTYGLAGAFSVTYTLRPTKSVDPGRKLANSIANKNLRERVAILRARIIAEDANIRRLTAELVALNVKPADIQAIIAGGEIPGNYDKLKLKYNVGMVKEAYFSPDKGFQNLAATLKGNNRPSKVVEAGELWSKSKSNKGMIWLYFPKDGGDNWSWQPPVGSPTEKFKYAFQFHYNPATISMGYSGFPDIDITTLTAYSAGEKFNYLGDKTTSTINFQLVVNRLFDFQYYDGGTKGGTLLPSSKDVYAGKEPSEEDQNRIFNYGTMYDLEFLLATVLGFKFETRLRSTTPDIGFLAGRPVDLHLGKGLRYWGYIASLGIDHKIFDERMVPIFSVIDIMFNRIPDYIEGGTNADTFSTVTAIDNTGRGFV